MQFIYLITGLIIGFLVGWVCSSRLGSNNKGADPSASLGTTSSVRDDKLVQGGNAAVGLSELEKAKVENISFRGRFSYSFRGRFSYKHKISLL